MAAFNSPTLTIMVKAAEKAARSLRRDFGEVEQLQVSRKGPGDFVTAADRRAEKIIFEELQAARPNYSFMMEESGEVKGDDKDHVWIIDPLDGTHNFMHGIPHWAISIALERKGEIISGLVYDPIKDEMFMAEKGMGAFLQNKRLRVSGRNNFEVCSFATGYGGFDAAKKKTFLMELNAVISVAPMIRRGGSAALDLAYVAAGRLDGYWEHDIKPWDVAAGVLIVKEAGGFVSGIGSNDNPVYAREIVAANAAIHNDLRTLVKNAA